MSDHEDTETTDETDRDTIELPDVDGQPTTGPEHVAAAVDEHGEAWVLEHYETELWPLSRIADMPDKTELPFFDPEEHEAMTDAELAEMAAARRQYRENLRQAGTGDQEDDDR